MPTTTTPITPLDHLTHYVVFLCALVVVSATATVIWKYRKDRRIKHISLLGFSLCDAVCQTSIGLYQYNFPVTHWRNWNTMLICMTAALGLWFLIGPNMGVFIIRRDGEDKIIERDKNEHS